MAKCNHGKTRAQAPYRYKDREPERADGILCPLAGFAPCRKAKCAWWDDDWLLCSVHYGSVYSSIRSATVDAAVEVAKEYATGEARRFPISASLADTEV